jgi:quercetin dioxygenase-like cupin family protein
VRVDPTWDREVSLIDKWGYHRYGLTMLHGTSLNATPVVVLQGQRNTPHASPREHIIYVLEGEMCCVIPWPDGPYYRMEPEDQLFIPGDMMYQYFNEGPDSLTFLSLSCYQGPDTPGAGFVTEVYSPIAIRVGSEATGEVVSRHERE